MFLGYPSEPEYHVIEEGTRHVCAWEVTKTVELTCTMKLLLKKKIEDAFHIHVCKYISFISFIIFFPLFLSPSLLLSLYLFS